MHRKEQFQDPLFHTILHAAMITLVMAIVLLLAVVPAWAQNVVPPTAREAAAMPAFASRLHRSVTPQAANKSQPPARNRTGRALPQDDVIYENGPVNGTTDAWTINFGYVVSDSFTGGPVTGFDIWVWELPGDTMTSVDWSITSGPNGGTVYGSGTASVTDTFISTNQYGYNIDKISASGLNSSSGGTWLNLFNAVVPSGDPVYWDENSGAGCHSSGCPSQAVESALGTIPSEAFDIFGNSNQSCFSEQQGGFKVIHDFTGGKDGGGPSGVASDKSGNLYVETSPVSGSASTVFKLAQKPSGWMLSPLYTFAGGSDGNSAWSELTIGPDGGVYGASNGGIQNCNGVYCGQVFRLKPSPAACLTSLCSWMENVLYKFTGSTDAWGAGALVFDQAGNLYGTSRSGGAQGKGAVFELTPSTGVWTENILYSFTGGSDGQYPNGVLVGNDGNLYGTALGGDPTCTGFGQGCGVGFRLSPSGSGWTESVLYDFEATPNDGLFPGYLVQDSSGNLYGISNTFSGGNQGGIVFMLSPANGKWVFTGLVYHGSNDLTDFFFNLTIDAAGNLYGTGGGGTVCRGSGCNWAASPAYNDFGYAFEMVPVGNGWQYQNLVYLPGDFWTSGPLALDARGNLFGTTVKCGVYDEGTVWQVSP